MRGRTDLKVYRPKQTRDGENSPEVTEEEDKEWAVNNRRDARNHASSSEVNRIGSGLEHIQHDRHLGIRTDQNKKRDTASSQMAEEQARPTGEKKPHRLNVRKTSRREKFGQMIAGNGIYRDETYAGDYLVIRSSEDQPN